ncbi:MULTISPECIES: methyltransferase domain-containing protein [unclassified Synechococcus]|uniref:class I SAM-dependent methyltransferase n=1 Tax=unclassified Synechococcus TaxID=2626047 RepID=UPI001CF8EA6A|nr:MULTISPECIES: methyltransferase domain-containing protein [unclassified Synechococcus]MCB4411940.1 class I SAM-dependent methyltransferase [Synechococcus sp. MU1611]
MNIHDSFKKKLKEIVFPEKSYPIRMQENGLIYHCICVEANREITVFDISKIRHLRNNKLPGILVKSFNEESGAVEVKFSGSTTSRQYSSISRFNFAPLIFPSIFQLENPFEQICLTISCDVDFLICSPPRIARKEFLRLAKGKGVEIGPGPSPQISNNDQTVVKYIEEKSADEWKNLYADFDDESKENWSSYQIGTASDIGEPDSSLDFIFASHVFEHLHNPIGHLKYWSEKLRPGGLVLLVVPQQSGTKDFNQNFTDIGNLKQEERGNRFLPSAENYYAWGQGRRKEYVDKLILEKASIHVHTYDYDSIIMLAEEMISRQVFSNYLIEYLPCTKDFLLAFRKL